MFNNKVDLYKIALEKYTGEYLLDLIEKNKDKQLRIRYMST
jgi:hypothetical protein